MTRQVLGRATDWRMPESAIARKTDSQLPHLARHVEQLRALEGHGRLRA